MYVVLRYISVHAVLSMTSVSQAPEGYDDCHLGSFSEICLVGVGTVEQCRYIVVVHLTVA